MERPVIHKKKREKTGISGILSTYSQVRKLEKAFFRGLAQTQEDE